MVGRPVSRVVVLHPAELASTLHQPRDDALVRERAAGTGRFVADDGPFDRYERTVRDLPGGGVEERIDFRIGVPVWGLVFLPGMRRALRSGATSAPWWAPPERLDLRAARVLGLLCSLTLVSGYLGTLLTQTVTFATDEFGADTTAQAGALATTRVGVVLAVVLAALADRLGRRRLVGASAVAGVVVTAGGALAPTLPALTATQIAARGFATALLLLIAIVSAEEMPAGSRAYAYSLLTLTGGLGAGLCLWALPLADLDERGWRLLYVLPLLFLPLLAVVRRHLPESRRFDSPHVEAPVAGHGRRFWLLAVSGMLLAVFAAPASQLQNEFLRDERGFSAARIVVFTALTVTPAAIGVVAGGRLADVHGRRVVAALGIAGGVGFAVLQYTMPGWPMWAWALTSSIVAGLAVPAFEQVGDLLARLVHRRRDDVAGRLVRDLDDVFAEVGLDHFEACAFERVVDRDLLADHGLALGHHFRVSIAANFEHRGAGLFGRFRPVHLAAGCQHLLLEAQQVMVQVGKRMVLDPSPGFSECLKLGQGVDGGTALVDEAHPGLGQRLL